MTNRGKESKTNEQNIRTLKNSTTEGWKNPQRIKHIIEPERGKKPSCGGSKIIGGRRQNKVERLAIRSKRKENRFTEGERTSSGKFEKYKERGILVGHWIIMQYQIFANRKKKNKGEKRVQERKE